MLHTVHLLGININNELNTSYFNLLKKNEVFCLLKKLINALW